MARSGPSRRGHTVEFGTLVGLEDLAAEELGELLEGRVPVDRTRPGFLRAQLPDLSLAELPRIAGVAYLVSHFEVPRPKALLGSQHLDALVGGLRQVVGRHPGRFTGVRVSAAGASSPVMQRLAAALAEAVGLPVDPDDGDLVVRVYPAEGGWTAAVRLTPRPLSARPWHVAGFPGALESTVAAAMVRLGRPAADDVFVDPCCGSGTIAIERASAGPARGVLAVDLDTHALRALTNNIAAAGSVPVTPIHGDASRLPFGAAQVSAMAANPPWGHQMGTQELTREPYPALLAEAARVTSSGSRFVLLSHQVRWTQQVLAESLHWRIEGERRLTLRGHHPRLWTLVRS
jgi:tRNA (guanine6-N2)-methyltransferase